MICAIVDQSLDERAVSVVVAPALTVLLTQAGDIGGFVSPIIVVVVWEMVGVRVDGAVKPETRKEGEGSYGEGQGKVASRWRALT